jgi:hypothetical protein
MPRDMIFLLCEKVPGLTSDWLYFGKPDGLPVELARRLGEFGGPQQSEPPRDSSASFLNARKRRR